MSDAPTIAAAVVYFLFGGAAGLVAFAFTWKLAREYMSWFGLLIGWIPGLIAGVIVLYLWPLFAFIGIGAWAWKTGQ